MSHVPKQGTQVVLKIELKIAKKKKGKVNIKSFSLSSEGRLNSLFCRLFSLRWTITLNHLRGHDMFRHIFIFVLNINHLIIYSRGRGDSKLNLD